MPSLYLCWLLRVGQNRALGMVVARKFAINTKRNYNSLSMLLMHVPEVEFLC